MEEKREAVGRKSLLFVNKKKQKNFVRLLGGGLRVCNPSSHSARGISDAPAATQTSVKVFLLLFVHKKKTFKNCLPYKNNNNFSFLGLLPA